MSDLYYASAADASSGLGLPLLLAASPSAAVPRHGERLSDFAPDVFEGGRLFHRLALGKEVVDPAIWVTGPNGTSEYVVWAVGFAEHAARSGMAAYLIDLDPAHPLRSLAPGGGRPLPRPVLDRIRRLGVPGAAAWATDLQGVRLVLPVEGETEGAPGPEAARTILVFAQSASGAWGRRRDSARGDRRGLLCGGDPRSHEGRVEGRRRVAAPIGTSAARLHRDGADAPLSEIAVGSVGARRRAAARARTCTGAAAGSGTHPGCTARSIDRSRHGPLAGKRGRRRHRLLRGAWVSRPCRRRRSIHPPSRCGLRPPPSPPPRRPRPPTLPRRRSRQWRFSRRSNRRSPLSPIGIAGVGSAPGPGCSRSSVLWSRWRWSRFG